MSLTSGFADRPLGMQDGYPDFAIRRRQTESVLLSFFHASSFELVTSGAFEYVETLLRARQTQAARSWIQLFDGGGNAIALRPEMTPSIARMAAPRVAMGQGPLQWCYCERIYRRTEDPASLSWASGKAAESTQVGVEWIGAPPSGESDAEILLLCHRALRQLDLPDAQIVVSHARFVPSLLRLFGFEDAQMHALLDCLTRGDYVAFRENAARKQGMDILGLLQRLTPTQTRDMAHVLPSSALHHTQDFVELQEAWSQLVALQDAITAMPEPPNLIFDLTLHRDIAYYTGLVFEVFADGVGAPIALGGRYDDLLEQFGASAPAIGFAFEIERVMAAKQAMGAPVKGGAPAEW